MYLTVLAQKHKFLSTLSLRRATNFWCLFFAMYHISIHALLAESDLAAAPTAHLAALFLSTLSLRRATDDILAGVNELLISIHALLAESDAMQIVVVIMHALFLSTLSLRRATPNFR